MSAATSINAPKCFLEIFYYILLVRVDALALIQSHRCPVMIFEEMNKTMIRLLVLVHPKNIWMI